MTVYILRQAWPRRLFAPIVATIAIGSLGGNSAAAAPGSGGAVFQEKCARCHGEDGQGVAGECDQPLAGDSSVAELAELIELTMPPDDPTRCVGDEARAAAAYIFDEFYSLEARRRRGLAPLPRIETLRLSVPQYRHAMADVIGHFVRGKAVDGQANGGGSEAAADGEEEAHGLRGEYFQSDGMNKADQQKLVRVDGRIDFDFGEGGPAEDIAADQFAIIWQGSLVTRHTGDYEFRVRTPNGARLYLNNDDVDQRGKLRDDSGSAGQAALIDAWVSSGKLREKAARAFLVGGRRYPLQLEFFKYQEKTASIQLEWKPPHGTWAIIDGAALAPEQAPRTYVVDEPFPADDRSLGYERGSSVSAEWHASVSRAALAAADEVVERLPLLAGITGSPADNRERIEQFLAEFFSVAYRRPLNADEQERIFQHVFAEGVAVEAAVRRGVLLALTSPHFLYAELTAADEAPSQHTVAARLALALWDSIPDEQLRQAADEGKLQSEDAVAEQARRMLSSPLAYEKVRRFFEHWLELEERDLGKDAQQFPEFNEQLAADLRHSLELFVEGVVWSEASDYRELLLSDELPLNAKLQQLYGSQQADELEPSADGKSTAAEEQFMDVTCSGQQRAGVLTHPYLLSMFAYHNNSSPIHRGVFLTRNVMGRSLKPPPAAIAFKDAEFDPNLTMREKVTALTRDAACMTCHSVINPLGFALENYDALGRWRTVEKDKPIDPHGEYVTLEGEVVTLKGARDIAEFAAGSEAAHRAFVVQLFHHLVQQNPDAYGLETIERLRQNFAADQFNVQNLIVRIATLAATHGSDQSSLAE